MYSKEEFGKLTSYFIPWSYLSTSFGEDGVHVNWVKAARGAEFLKAISVYTLYKREVESSDSPQIDFDQVDHKELDYLIKYDDFLRKTAGREKTFFKLDSMDMLPKAKEERSELLRILRINRIALILPLVAAREPFYNVVDEKFFTISSEFIGVGDDGKKKYEYRYKEISEETVRKRAGAQYLIKLNKRENPLTIEILEEYKKYFDVWRNYGSGGDHDNTDVNWVKAVSDDYMNSLEKFVSIKETLIASDYYTGILNIMDVIDDRYRGYVFDTLFRNTTFFELSSADVLPKDPVTRRELFDRLEKNQVYLMVLISWGLYFDVIRKKYYEVSSSTGWGSVDDADSFTVYHLSEITEESAKDIIRESSFPKVDLEPYFRL